MNVNNGIAPHHQARDARRKKGGALGESEIANSRCKERHDDEVMDVAYMEHFRSMVRPLLKRIAAGGISLRKRFHRSEGPNNEV